MARARAAVRTLCLAAAVSLVAAPGWGGPKGGMTAREALAEGVGPVTKLPIPRYVSLNASRVNVRRGPGLDYRIDWVFARDGLPVRVVDEHAHWRRIRDHEGDDGWVYHALLSGRRTVVVTAPGVVLRSRPAGPAMTGICGEVRELPDDAVGCAEGGVVAGLEACEADWCRIEARGVTGWAPISALWGAEPPDGG